MDESYDDQPHVEDIEILDEDIPAPLEQSSEPSELNAQLILLIAVVAILIVLLLRKLLSSSKGNSILLVGPCNSGKTTLFLSLKHGSPLNGTIASMHPNDAEFPLPSSNTTTTTQGPLIRVIDIPGHPRIRGRYFDQHISPAAGIVFVIDSVDFMPRKTEAAEQLYEILTHPVVSKKRLPILLACNKADAGPKAHTVDFIRKRLERELDAVRETRGALDDIGSDHHHHHNNSNGNGGRGGGGGGVYLGPVGEAFTFEALATKAKGPLVTATAVSAVDAGGWSDVVVFIKKCIR